MKIGVKSFCLCIILTCIGLSVYADYPTNKPVTKNASPEAVALLNLFYDISGNYMLTGQHNFPNIKDRNTQFAKDYFGKTPIVFSTDWGFAEKDNTDSYLARPDIVKEAIRQHQMGSIVTICWHAVPPTANEPITFNQLPNASPDSLASVQGRLIDKQFKELLTPGTKLYKHWCQQVDSVAIYLKELQDAHVPILWRPYHEMNGMWFWWGGRTGKYSTIALYKQLFDRLVNYHKLNNLVWVWSVDRIRNPEMQYSNFFPGTDFFDIAAVDVYDNDFNQAYYDSLQTLSHGKPMVLGEVGNPPAIEIIDKQPKWGYFVTWAGMVRNTSKKQYEILLNDPRILTLEDSVYWKISAPYRQICGLDPLPYKTKLSSGFSGNWVFNEEKSVLEKSGASGVPYKMTILLADDKLSIQKTSILEYADDKVTVENIILDGKDYQSEFLGNPNVSTAVISKTGDSIIIQSKVKVIWGDKKFEIDNKDSWSIQGQGSILSIEQSSSSLWGDRKQTLIYDRITNK